MMTGKNDDAASTREDTFLSGLIPQVTENLAEQHAGNFDAQAGQARFETWLTAHTKEPAVPAKGRASDGYAKPRRTGWVKRFLTRLPAAWPGVPIPDGRLLTWLSGAQRQILEECPTERTRYVGLGASILTSAAMAGVSLAFALVTALNTSMWVALPVAFAWGIAVLGLTRLFVITMPRSSSAGVQLLRALPRLLLSLLLSFVISAPLVLQVFRPEIQHQVTVLHNQAAAAYYEQASTNPLAKQVAADQAEVNKAIAELAQAKTGEQAAALKQEVSTFGQELQADQAALQQQTHAFTTTDQDNTGLLIRLQALDAITADNPALAAAWWLLVALLVLIGCAPILITALINSGPVTLYERILAEEEKFQLELAERRRAVERDVQVRDAEAIAAGERSRIAAFQAEIPDITSDIIAARRRVEAQRLRRWEADQIRRLAQEPASAEPSQDKVTPQDRGALAARQEAELIWRESPDQVGVGEYLRYRAVRLPLERAVNETRRRLDQLSGQIDHYRYRAPGPPSARYRLALYRRERARREHQQALDALALADDRFIAEFVQILISHGHDEESVRRILASVTRFNAPAK